MTQDRIDRLRALCRTKGLRMTPQREVLVRALAAAAHHPTAEQVYRRVRRAQPSISPATVYRNLQTLVRAGVISTLERAGAVRYDPNADEHHHFLCTGCGRVTDIYLAGVDYAVRARRSALPGAAIRSCHVQLHGLCGRCNGRG